MQSSAQTADEAIAREIERVIASEVDEPRLKALLESPASFDLPLWKLAVEQGWPGLSLPTDIGGLGLGWRDLAEVAQVLGHATVSLPLIQATVVARVLMAADNAQALRPHADTLASGNAIVSVALMEPGDAGLAPVPNLTLKGDTLTGAIASAPFANVAQLALVRAQRNGKAVLALVELNEAVTRHTAALIDNARAAASLEFTEAPALVVEGASALGDVLALSALMTAFEQIGGAAACLELAKSYAMEHKAFGQPIGAFQAIKHKMADIYTAIEIARGCALEALQELEQGSLSLEATAAARISASRAYDFAAQEAIQTHGGMGITWEGFLHHHYRRARSLALELGSTAYWRNLLIDQLVAGAKV
ncbi:MAG: acyl-CoA dehydrogenase [Spongiibacteraceae bacterium]|nr:acyl-CoA dehydrogenase [Spongiibacteraceae bacterium]|tara:strand:- start:109 stop:1200 length:1092 start_codon:yes stop_codon:yes gene_type:complete